MAVGQNYGVGAVLVLIVVAGAVAGCLCSLLLYRLWMAISGGVLLGIVVPLVWVTWIGSPPPADQRLDLSQPAPHHVNAATGWQHIRDVVEHQHRTISRWWSDLGPAKQRELAVIGSIAGLVGLVLGLVMPNLAASVQSAMVGSLLAMFSAGALWRMHWPDHAAILPDSPRPLLVALGLITLSGVLVQWTIWRRKADNGS